MTVALPLFEGHGVAAAAVSVTGTISDESSQPAEALDIGDTVTLVVSARVIAINHKDKDDIVTRWRTLSVTEAYITDVETLRDARAANDDAAETIRATTTGQDRLMDPATGELLSEAKR